LRASALECNAQGLWVAFLKEILDEIRGEPDARFIVSLRGFVDEPNGDFTVDLRVLVDDARMELGRGQCQALIVALTREFTFI